MEKIYPKLLEGRCSHPRLTDLFLRGNRLGQSSDRSKPSVMGEKVDHTGNISMNLSIFSASRPFPLASSPRMSRERRCSTSSTR
jgi:hypothetical protein